MAQLVRAQVSYLRMTTGMVGNPEVMSSILIPSKLFVSAHLLIHAQVIEVDVVPKYSLSTEQASSTPGLLKAPGRERGYKQCILYLSIQSSQRFQRAFQQTQTVQPEWHLLPSSVATRTSAASPIVNHRSKSCPRIQP